MWYRPPPAIRLPSLKSGLAAALCRLRERENSILIRCEKKEKASQRRGQMLEGSRHAAAANQTHGRLCRWTGSGHRIPWNLFVAKVASSSSLNLFLLDGPLVPSSLPFLLLPFFILITSLLNRYFLFRHFFFPLSNTLRTHAQLLCSLPHARYTHPRARDSSIVGASPFFPFLAKGQRSYHPTFPF
ncbi:hypothetical protein J3F83DRAFT_481908 [Trichoderma novae-zelandiae]